MAASSSASGAMSPGGDYLSDLPPELMTSILKDLRLREICRARQVSKHFKSIIDANQAEILRDVIAEHKARIKIDYKLLVSTAGLDFYAAFQGFVNYYSSSNSEDADQNITRRFWEQYIYTRYGGVALPTTLLVISAADSCLSVLRQGAPGYDKGKIIARLSAFVTTANSFGHKELAQSFKMPPIIPLPSSIRCPQSDAFPRFFLTEVCAPITMSATLAQFRCPRDFSVILEWLGLPVIGKPRRFTYCLQSEKLLALASKAWQISDGRLSLFEEAALLEDIYIW